MKTLAHSQDKAEILRRLRQVRSDTPRKWGRMSAQQMVCHLTDSFRFAIGQKPVSDGSSMLTRTIIKWIALYGPSPWPTGLMTRPEVDQERGGTAPAEFAADVAQLEQLVDSVAASGRDFVPRHPIFGSMSKSDWLRWSYLHVDHHLRQFGA
jgi:hypothetical protein